MVSTKEAIQELSDRALLKDFLEKEGIEFKHINHGWIGLCPFHNEKTPSFNIFEDTQRYYCFGCQKSGYITNYLMDKEGLSWHESLARLCEIYNIQLDDNNNSEELENINKIKEQYEATKALGKFFKEEFDKLDVYHPAKTMILNRGLALDTIDYGYAPEDRNAVKEFLYPYLKNKLFTIDTLLELGYFKKSDNGKNFFTYKNRLMFYYKSQKNKIEGFTGRALTKEDESKRKYINSNNSLIFQKSREIFNYSYARSFINKNNAVYIVEGQFDVVAMIEAGYPNTIAISGTAFDNTHINRIKIAFKNKTSAKYILCLDNDEAGQEAIYKIFTKNPTIQRNLYVIQIPKGKDPCDYLGKDKSNPIMEPILYTDFIFNRLKEKYVTKVAVDPFDLIQEFTINYISFMNDELKRLYINRLSAYCRVKISDVNKFLTNKNVNKEDITVINSKPTNITNEYYNKAIALLYANFWAFNSSNMRIDEYPKVYIPLIEKIINNNKINLESLMTEKNKEVLGNIINNLEYIPEYEELIEHYNTLLDYEKKQKSIKSTTEKNMFLKSNLETAKSKEDIINILNAIEPL